MRAGHLKERELDGPELGPELQGVGRMGDGYVLNEIPDVVVLFGGQPVGSADSAVTAEAHGGQSAV